MTVGDKALTGSAGVHYVAFQLSSRGYAVGLTAPAVKGVDLLATEADRGTSVSIQVKTATNAHVDVQRPNDRWKWRVGVQLAEGHSQKHFFIAFIDLRDGPPAAYDMPWDPDVFVVPSGHLQKYVWGYPEKKPRAYWFVIPVKDAHKYRNRWDRIDAALK